MDRKIKNSFWIIGLIIFAMIIIGATFYKFAENMSWVDSFYSTVLLLATAGSGKISAIQTSSKIFTILFVLLAVPITLFCIGYIVEEFFKARLKKIDSKMEEVIREEENILKEEKKILNKEKELLERK